MSAALFDDLTMQRDFLDRLKSKANVSIALDAPRIDVIIAANDPAMGPADAPVTIVEDAVCQ